MTAVHPCESVPAFADRPTRERPARARAAVTFLDALPPQHDVRRPGALIEKVLDSRMSEWGSHLRPEDREDAVSFLVACSLELERSFNAKLGIAYSTYLFRMLRFRLVDFYRVHFGDSRYGNGADRIEYVDDETLARLVEPESEGDEPAPPQFDLAKLTPESQMTYEKFVRPMHHLGLKPAELAEAYGHERREVARKLKRLRDEIHDLLAKDDGHGDSR